METISYNQILNQFDLNKFHISYLTYNDLIKLMNFPIKSQASCSPRTREEIYYHPTATGILVIKHTTDYDYSIDRDIQSKLSNLNISYIAPINYLPLKMAQVLAGTGQYGKNQVIYDYQFGFETHVGLAIIYNSIIDLPERNKPNFDFLPQCKNCYDCEKACPVNALHSSDNPPWVDWVACDEFNRYGNDIVIPSMKWGWGKQICNPPIDDMTLYEIQNDKDLINITNYKIIPSQYDDNGVIKYIQYPICRECTSQPKCSKFNGQYPYNKDRVKFY